MRAGCRRGSPASTPPLAGTTRNPNSLSPLTITISDPPTQGEVQAILDAHNAQLTATLR